MKDYFSSRVCVPKRREGVSFLPQGFHFYHREMDFLQQGKKKKKEPLNKETVCGMSRADVVFVYVYFFLRITNYLPWRKCGSSPVSSVFLQESNWSWRQVVGSSPVSSVSLPESNWS
jgi:hypothetical protein